MYIKVTVNLKITTNIIYKAIHFLFLFEQTLDINTFSIKNTYFSKN